MPAVDLFQYLDPDGEAVVAQWIATLPDQPKAAVRARLVALAQMGDELFPTILSDTSDPQIKKLRIRGRLQVRPLLCRGPVVPPREFTLLHGAIEKDNELEPRGVLADAAKRRLEVAAEPARRRRPYVT